MTDDQQEHDPVFTATNCLIEAMMWAEDNDADTQRLERHLSSFIDAYDGNVREVVNNDGVLHRAENNKYMERILND